MIKIIENPKTIKEIINRTKANNNNKKVGKIVQDIIENVRKNGDKALFDYTLKFDGAKLSKLKVDKSEIENAFDSTDKFFIDTLLQAKKNIEDFHKLQLRKNFEIKKNDGIRLGQIYKPIEKAGIYIPGGTASYPSSVLMNAIPAKIAGVKDIVMVTPPDKSGNINQEILVAAKIAGVDKIYKIGGAQAIAALAYGTETVPKVDKIVGPGNIFVATAKKQVFGEVSIDMIAGPSEILVIADETANPNFVAADLLSQAEHDKLATAILITNSKQLANDIQTELETQLKALPRYEIAKTSIENNGKIIITESIEKAISISNEIAPEHLEIVVDNPFDFLHLVKNAGSIFLGKFAPEALGDYFAGPNHTLPTSGTAKFSSPLSVDDFIKRSSYIYYTDTALKKVKENISDFANREGLDAHANSVLIRFKENGNE